MAMKTSSPRNSPMLSVPAVYAFDGLAARFARDGVMRRSQRRTAPIIAMSADVLANGPAAEAAVAREPDVAAVLVKPFGRDALMQAIKRARTST
jgi:CheY-like chemotaxis protein